MKGKKLAVGLAVIFLLATVLLAEETKKPVELTGFYLADWTSQLSEVRRNSCLVLDGNFGKDLAFKSLVQMEGPTQTVRYLSLRWQKPSKNVDAVFFGRDLPPFGREWFWWRVDRLPWGTYSKINSPAVVSDIGLTVIGHNGTTRWYAGAYVGDRLFGNVPQFASGGDWLFRVEQPIADHLEIGAGCRLGPVEAYSADLFYKQGRRIGLLEMVSSDGKIGVLLSGVYPVSPKVDIVARRDWPVGNVRNLVGINVLVRPDLTLKLTREWAGDSPDLFRGQVASSGDRITFALESQFRDTTERLGGFYFLTFNIYLCFNDINHLSIILENMTKKIIYWLVGIIVVLIVVAVGIKTDLFGLINKLDSGANGSAVSGYHAVFLSNGQVYFGQLDDINDNWVKLSKIYYLQVEQKLQPKAEETANTDAKTEQPKLSLVKLGNELHGPTDEMQINTKHVIFYEKLKDKGQVVKSIKKYLEDQAKK